MTKNWVKAVKADKEGATATARSEWTIFHLIVTHLMRRDYGRSPLLAPQRRRKFLQRLAVWLSQRGHQFITEDDFVELIGKEFRTELARRASEDRQAEIDRLFADLRSSGTLTRVGSIGTTGWRFSHNSLREYLVAELLLDELLSGRFVGDGVYVTDAMRVFVASQLDADIEGCLAALAKLWPDRAGNLAAGEVLSLLWDAGLRVQGTSAGQPDPVSRLLRRVGGGSLDLSRTTLRRVVLSRESEPSSLEGANCSRATLIDLDLSAAKLRGGDFSGALLDNVSFCSADLRESRFSGATLMDVNFSGTELNGADFTSVAEGDISIKVDARTIEGRLALGYLRHSGADTEDIPEYFVVVHHPDFDVVEKICRKVTEQAKRQRRGLEQRGAANRNPDAARRFVRHLVTQSLVEIDSHDLVSPTEVGRNVFRRFCEEQTLDPELAAFFRT